MKIQSMEWKVKARKDNAMQVKAKLGKAWQGKAGLGLGLGIGIGW
jgi:hypothetical protein